MVFVSSKLFSGSPGEYMLGAKQTTKRKTSWGYSVDVFSEPSFRYQPSLMLPGGGNGLLFFHFAPAGQQAGCWRRFPDEEN